MHRILSTACLNTDTDLAASGPHQGRFCDSTRKPLDPLKVDAPIEILQLTDFHLLAGIDQRFYGIRTWQSLKDTLDEALLHSPQPDLVLLTGDLAQNALPETYEALRPLIDKIPGQTVALPGNHDSPSLIAKSFSWSAKVIDRVKVLGPWMVIPLDSCKPGSPVGHLRPSELDELEAILDEASGYFVLIALHHPPIATQSAWLDTMQISNSSDFQQRIEKYPNVRAVVFGHIHQEWLSHWNDTILMGTPSTGFQFAPKSDVFNIDPIPPGYRRISLKSDGTVKTSVHRLSALPEGFDPNAKGYGS